MEVSKFNSERDYDTVVYEALTGVEEEKRVARVAAAYRPLVYIGSPYADDVEKNTFRARAFSYFAVPAAVSTRLFRRNPGQLLFLYTNIFKEECLSVKEFWNMIQFVFTIISGSLGCTDISGVSISMNRLLTTDAAGVTCWKKT